MSINDLLQLELDFCHNMPLIYTEKHWDRIKIRLQYVPFLQPSWSLMMFTLLRWPYQHELQEESLWTER